VPNKKDPPSVSNAHNGATPYSFMPHKPTMMDVTRAIEHTMCEMTVKGFMIIDSDKIVEGLRVNALDKKRNSGQASRLHR
jgi:hypothetical protein